MQAGPQFQRVQAMVERLGNPLSVFDLETTSFRGRPNFAIMEAAVFMVVPGRKTAVAFGHLINPERPIDAVASRVTGITSAMVAGAQTWGERYAALFQKLAKEHILAGFNSNSFDCPALMDMGARYGHPIDGIAQTMDVRLLHFKLSGLKSRKGKLVEVAAQYGVRPRAAMHRASADVVLTLETLDAMLGHYGHQVLLDCWSDGTGRPSERLAA